MRILSEYIHKCTDRKGKTVKHAFIGSKDKESDTGCNKSRYEESVAKDVIHLNRLCLGENILIKKDDKNNQGLNAKGD